MKGKWKTGEKDPNGRRGGNSTKETRDEGQITERLSDEAQGIIIYSLQFICVYIIKTYVT